jgi:hypothetical protein
MNTTGLAANQFRIAHTRDKLARAPAKDRQQEIRTHEAVGRGVREASKRYDFSREQSDKENYGFFIASHH